MKTKIRIVLSAFLLVSGFIAACGPSTSVESSPAVEAAQTRILATPVDDLTSVDETGSTSIIPVSLPTQNPRALTQAEIDSLYFMREEEKLARDVYLYLYDLWQINIFANIASSEQTHTDAVKNLIISYGLEDLAANSADGEFANADLQNLYEQLIMQGSQSLADALKVGAAIEEIDILDLVEQMGLTENPSILNVYENLMKGSRNHLRSFTSVLAQQTSEIYQPAYLTLETFQSIVGSQIESGGQGNGKRP